MRLGCRLLGRRSRSRLRCLFFLEVDYRRGERPFFCQNGEAQRGHHEHDGDDDGKFAEKVRRSTASEHRLTGTAEGRADFRAFPRLEENGADHEKAGDDVNDDDQCVHESTYRSVLCSERDCSKGVRLETSPTDERAVDIRFAKK